MKQRKSDGHKETIRGTRTSYLKQQLESTVTLIQQLQETEVWLESADDASRIWLYLAKGNAAATIMIGDICTQKFRNRNQNESCSCK